MDLRNFHAVSTRAALVASITPLIFSAALAHAQTSASYPDKSIRLVVPFAAGGALDVVGRIVGQKMTEAWGKQVVIDNRLGAGGNIGAESVFNAPPDGDWQNYTPVVSDALQSHSVFDPTQTAPQCVVGHTGMRNQNIYTARVTEGLFVGSPGNAKPLGGATGPPR